MPDVQGAACQGWQGRPLQNRRRQVSRDNAVNGTWRKFEMRKRFLGLAIVLCVTFGLIVTQNFLAQAPQGPAPGGGAPGGAPGGGGRGGAGGGGGQRGGGAPA